MQGKFQRRSPAVRARHGKRLPQLQSGTGDGDGGGGVPGFPGPITVTIVQTRQPQPPAAPTVTIFVPPTSTTPLPTPNPSPPPSSTLVIGSPLSQGPLQPTTSATSETSASPSSSASSTSSTSVIARPTPSASVNNNGTKNEMTESNNTSASRGIPIGSIIGIAIAVVLVLIALVVFLIRRRSVQNRLKARGGWANKGVSGPSFLWIEPGEKSTINAYPITSGQNRGGGASPGTTLVGAPTQASFYAPSNVPYTPPAAPPRPPPVQGTQPSYNPSYGPSTSASSALGLTIPPALVPGNKAVPAPSAYLSPPAPGGPALSPETATVRSTFIPTLPDELSISTGEVVRIMSAYDDGWALCSNARQEVGMVPLECLDRGGASLAQQEGREYRGLSRASSLAASPDPYGGIRH